MTMGTGLTGNLLGGTIALTEFGRVKHPRLYTVDTRDRSVYSRVWKVDVKMNVKC